MNTPAKGSKRRLAFALLLAAWLLKFTFGLIAALRNDAPSYPDAVRGFPSPYMGDIEFYVLVPAAFVILNMLMFIFANRTPKWLAMTVVALQAFLLSVLLFFGTGGI